MLYIKFLHTGLSTIGLYTKELDREIFYFQWPPEKNTVSSPFHIKVYTTRSCSKTKTIGSAQYGPQ